MNSRTFYAVYTHANYFTVILPCTATKATVLISNNISLLVFTYDFKCDNIKILP